MDFCYICEAYHCVKCRTMIHCPNTFSCNKAFCEEVDRGDAGLQTCKTCQNRNCCLECCDFGSEFPTICDVCKTFSCGENKCPEVRGCSACGRNLCPRCVETIRCGCGGAIVSNVTSWKTPAELARNPGAKRAGKKNPINAGILLIISLLITKVESAIAVKCFVPTVVVVTILLVFPRRGPKRSCSSNISHIDGIKLSLPFRKYSKTISISTVK